MEHLTEAATHFAQLLIAFLLALPIAWDREQRERSAGLRTFTLVAISTCAFLLAARDAFSRFARRRFAPVTPYGVVGMRTMRDEDVISTAVDPTVTACKVTPAAGFPGEGRRVNRESVLQARRASR